MAPISRLCRHEVVHSHQVVGRQGKEKERVDRFLSPDLHLPQASRQFDPSEDLLDSLSKLDALCLTRLCGDPLLTLHKIHSTPRNLPIDGFNCL